MLDTHSATARLVRQMKSTESAVSNALVEAIGLMHTAAIAQRDVKAPAADTQAAMLRMTKLVEGLVSAQGDTMRVHGQLKTVSREVNGTPETGGPPEPECPDEPLFTSAQAVNFD